MAAPQTPTIYESPNHGGKRPQTLGIILHSTRSGLADNVQEYSRTISYMMQADTVSSHRVIGLNPVQHARMVEDDLIAWHAQEDNLGWLSIELVQARPIDPYSIWQVDTAIEVCIAWCLAYGIAPSQATIRRHSDTEQGKRNGKSDPGPFLIYDEFVKDVADSVAITRAGLRRDG